MIVLKNTITKQINQFESMSQIGASYATWMNITDTDEAKDYLLQKAKDEKIKELNSYYNSDECWLFRLKSTTLKASLTKTADFFAKVLPAIDSSFPVYFETDDKKIISTNLTSEKAKKINAKIQLEISIYIKKLRIETELKINNCKSEEEIALINVKKALGVVPREIEIDNI
jgi:hypothetical protein